MRMSDAFTHRNGLLIYRHPFSAATVILNTNKTETITYRAEKITYKSSTPTSFKDTLESHKYMRVRGCSETGSAVVWAKLETVLGTVENGAYG